jgi:hypothetical protein
LAAATNTGVASIVLTVGAWLLFGNLSFPGSSSTSFSSVSINTVINVVDINATSNVVCSSPVLQVTRYAIVTSGTQTMYLVANAATAQTVQYMQFYAIRVG